jgi:hypothetical protein
VVDHAYNGWYIENTTYIYPYPYQLLKSVKLNDCGEEMSERTSHSVEPSDSKIIVNLKFQVIPDNILIFSENLRLGENDRPEFIPKEYELEFNFPDSSGTSRLVYKDLSSFD